MYRRRNIAADERGGAAVEFAFVAPLFILLTFGMIAFGSIISTYHAIEQLAAEAARASLGGTTTAERDQLARTFISGSLSSYPFLFNSSRAVTPPAIASPPSFKVTLTYDMSSMFAMSWGTLVPLPPPRLTRSS